jgi:hypothetical protein
MGNDKYYVLDFDHTLGDFTHFEFFLRMFKVNDWLDFLKVPQVTISDTLFFKITSAYNEFVKEIASRIEEYNMFNMHMIERIDDILKNNKNIVIDKNEKEIPHFILYTNNQHAEKVKCAVDILNVYFGRELFCLILNWDHPLREEDKKGQKKGTAIKQWSTLKRGILEACRLDDLDPQDVYFYDDYIHNDLKKVLGENYTHVEEFYRRSNKQELFFSMYGVLEKYELDEDKEYMDILAKVFEKDSMSDSYIQLWFQGLIENKVRIIYNT